MSTTPNDLEIVLKGSVDSSVARAFTQFLTTVTTNSEEAKKVIDSWSNHTKTVSLAIANQEQLVSSQQVKFFQQTQQLKESYERQFTSGVKKELSERSKAWNDAEKESLRILKITQNQALQEISKAEKSKIRTFSETQKIKESLAAAMAKDEKNRQSELVKLHAQALKENEKRDKEYFSNLKRVEEESQKLRSAMLKDQKDLATKNDAYLKSFSGLSVKDAEKDPATDTNAIGNAILFWTRLTGVIQAAKAAYYTVKNGAGFFAQFIGEGLEYNSLIKDSVIGFAGIISGLARVVDLQGKLVPESQKWNKSLEISDRIVDSLQLSAFKTKATYSELARGLQEGLAPLLNARLKENQLEPFVTRFVQVMTALRVPIREIGQEIRGLLQGDTNAKNSRVSAQFMQEFISQGLHAKTEIRKIIQNDDFYDWFMKKSAEQGRAGSEMMNNLSGAASNLKEAWERTLGEGTKVLWEQLTKTILDGTDAIIQFDKNGKAIFNDALVEAIRKVANAFSYVAIEAAAAVNAIIKPGGAWDTFKEWKALTDKNVQKANEDIRNPLIQTLDDDIDWLKSHLFGKQSIGNYVVKQFGGNPDKDTTTLNPGVNIEKLLEYLSDKTKGSVPASENFFGSVAFKSTRKPVTATIEPGPVAPKSEEEIAKESAKAEKLQRQIEAREKAYQNELAIILKIRIENQKRIEDTVDVNKIQEIKDKLSKDLLTLDEKRIDAFKQIKGLHQKSLDEVGTTKSELFQQTNSSVGKGKAIATFQSVVKIQEELDKQSKKNSEEVEKIQLIQLENKKKGYVELNKIQEIENKLNENLLTIDQKRLKTLNDIEALKNSSFVAAGTTKEEMHLSTLSAYGKEKMAALAQAAIDIQNSFDKTSTDTAKKRATEEARTYARQLKEVTSQLRTFEDMAGNFITGITQGGKGFAEAMAKSFTNTISAGSTSLIKKLMALVSGVTEDVDSDGKTVYKDKSGNIIKGAATFEEAVTKGGNQKNLKQFQTIATYAQIGVGAYTQGQTNAKGSVTQGVIGGAVSGLTLGWAGAIVGAIVGGLAAAAGKADARSDYKFAQFRVNAGKVSVDTFSKQNISDDKLKGMITQVQTALDTTWNGMVNLMVKIKGVIPILGNIDADFQKGPSGHFLENFDDWLNNKLPQVIIDKFKSGMSKAAVGLGMASDKFNLLWDKISLLDPSKQVEIFTNLFGALDEFKKAIEFIRGDQKPEIPIYGPYTPPASRQRVTNVTPGSRTWETYKKDPSVLRSNFSQDTQEARDNMLNLGRALNSLTGEAQISAAKELSGLMTDYVTNTKAYMKDLVSLSANIKNDVESMIMDLTAQGITKIDENGNRVADAEGQAQYYKQHADDLLVNLSNATNADDVRKFWSEYTSTLSKIQSLQSSLGPDNAEAIRVWMIKALQMGETYFQAKIDSLGKDVDKVSDWINTNVTPYITAFNSIINSVGTDLNGVGNGLGGIKDPIDKLPGQINLAGNAFNTITATLNSVDSSLSRFGSRLDSIILNHDSGMSSDENYARLVSGIRSAS